MTIYSDSQNPRNKSLLGALSPQNLQKGTPSNLEPWVYLPLLLPALEYPFTVPWFLHLYLSLLICFMLSFPQLPFEPDILVTCILPRAAFFSFIGHNMKITRSIYWTDFVSFINIIKSDEWNHLFTFLSTWTKLNFFCFWRSLTLSSSSGPLMRGPQADRPVLAEKSSTSAHKQTLMISWLKLILKKKTVRQGVVWQFRVCQEICRPW